MPKALQTADMPAIRQLRRRTTSSTRIKSVEPLRASKARARQKRLQGISVRASFVICWQLLLRVALGLLVVDPELRMFLCHYRRNLVHRLQRGLLVPVIVRD